MTTHGHARTSTRDQKPAMQIAALRAAGVDEVHEETTAGAKSRRAEGRHDRPITHDISQIRHARDLIADGTSVRLAARMVGIPRSSLADALKRLPGYRL
jgi:DNA invertase Pin-like site-specific DNA recombinase